MADDIVNQLRAISQFVGAAGPKLREAADEITRLRAEVASLTQQCDDYSDEIGNCRVLEWRELSDQLAEALRWVSDPELCEESHETIIGIWQAAHAALAAYEAARKEADRD